VAEVGSELPASFGKYFLTEKLATGGMAEIYLAKLIGPDGFEKALVIKQIHPRLGGQRAFVDLFVAEAKTLVGLTHGNIVPVYELGVVDDTYYIAMEYIDGPTLWRLTEALARRDAVMNPAVAAWVAARILDGLDYAHRKGEGVIHRDLSPRNVMMSRDGEVKLVDFGIAIAHGEREGEHDAPPTGSFPYMSPEQVRREALTGQSDLFSAGVLAWEMLTGQRLFARADPETTLAAVTGADIPRPSTVRPEVPAKLEDVVMKALDRDRDTRWASAGDMLAALNRYLYSLDDTPGARDVAAMVAKYCPPETRRLATQAEAVLLGHGDGDGTEATDPSAIAAAVAAADAKGADVLPPVTPAAPVPAASGPRTAVIPRDGVARGKKQRAPTRQQSFATHVDLEKLVAPAAAAPPAPADAAAEAPEPVTEIAPRSSTRLRTIKTETETATETEIDLDAPIDRRAPIGPPAGSMMWLGAVAAMVLGVGSIYVFYHGRGAVLAPDAAPKYDAASWSFEPDARVADARPADAGLDAGSGSGSGTTPIDAAVAAAIDAGVIAPRIDAGSAVATHIDAGALLPAIDAATGTATLVVGADPWGDITVDGKPSGTTPQTLTVSAGHHAIVVTFRGVDPPRSKSYTVDLLAGETNHLPVSDFTKP
jgi:tRNA A-37 threonylcarbamoyl transferase component Bud32